jgi:hypothetical protein
MIKTDKNFASTYKDYTDNHTPVVSKKEYIDINKMIVSIMMEKIIEGDEVVLPGKLGEVFVKGTKKKIVFNEQGVPNLPPNWKATKELREKNPEAAAKRTVVYYTNEETGGVSYRVFWSKNRVPILNKTMVHLRITKGNKTRVSQSIKSGKEYQTY